MGLLITGARVAGQVVAIRLGETIAEVGPNLRPAGDDEVLDVGGAEAWPGLHDHHVHLLAMAAARMSVLCGPPAVVDRAGLHSALAAADRSLPGGEWIRGVGYHESVAGDLDRVALDALVSGRPVRVQHRSGVLWVLNSAGLYQLGVGLPHDGRLWRRDEWLRTRLPERAIDLSVIGREAAERGITGFTDATPHRNPARIAHLAKQLSQRVLWMAAPEADHAGPAKVLLDDDRLPALDDLVARLRPARAAGRNLAFHCVSHVQAALALAALEDLGARPGDRIEHGALLSPGQVQQIGQMGATVVTQPGLVFSRGDRYLEDVDQADRADLWRLGSLLGAGVAVAAGSDAPFGPSDPWTAVESAVTRRTVGGRSLGPQEAVERETALGLFFGTPDRPAARRSVAPGQPGDLCLIGPQGVEGTIIGGRVVYPG